MLGPRAFVIVLLLTGSTACRGNGTDGRPITLAAVEGCYLFEWSQRPFPSTSFMYPDSVRLIGTHACPECPPDSRGAQYLTLARFDGTEAGTSSGLERWDQVYYASWWLWSPTDSLTVVFNNNSYLWALRLAVTDDGLVGEARWSADDGGQASVPVSARRAQCP